MTDNEKRASEDLGELLDAIYGKNKPLKGNGTFKGDSCYWCGEEALETILFEEEKQTGYKHYISICKEKFCQDRTKRAMRIR